MSEKLTSLLAACAVTALGLALAAPAVAAPSPVVVTATSEDIPDPLRHPIATSTLPNADRREDALSRVKHAVNDVCIESVGDDHDARRFDREDDDCRD